MEENKKVSFFSKLFKKEPKKQVEQQQAQVSQQTQEQTIKTGDYDTSLSQHILTKNTDITREIPLDSLKPYDEEIVSLMPETQSVSQEPVTTTPQITSESLGIKPDQILSGNVEEQRPDIAGLQENKVEEQVPIFDISASSLNQNNDMQQVKQDEVVAPDLSEFVEKQTTDNEQRPIINNAAINPVIFVKDEQSKGISR